MGGATQPCARAREMGNSESSSGSYVDEETYLPNWEGALCVCPGDRKDLQILGMGVNGCQTRENQELRKLDESLLASCTAGTASGAEIQALIRRGAAVNAVRQPEEKTALHLAAHAGGLDAAQVLVQNGADVDTVDCDDRTPLHVAALNGHQEMVDFLLETGASYNMLDKNDQTALHFACIGGYLEVCSKLIEAGAFVEVDTASNLQPLHFAALSGHTSIAKLLIHHGADINCLCAE